MPMPRSPDPEKFCKHCGARMRRKQTGKRLEDMGSFRRRVFCNRACMTSHMEGTIKVHNNRNSHRQSCKKVEGACQVCGATNRRLHVHHIDGNGLNNNLDNLITLCVPCHRRAHSPNFTDLGRSRKPCRLCPRPAVRGGLCGMHTQRAKKYGSPFLTKRRESHGYILIDERG